MIKSFLKYTFCICVGSILLLASCERDDICAASTPTTPLLIIRFYDAANPTELKAVSNLDIIENGTGITESGTFSSDSIAIPLRTNMDITSLELILNSTSDIDDTENPINADLINFEYTRSEDFISKACGFRVIYNDLQEFRAPQDDGFWIQNLIIDNSTIDNETTAHIRIFH